MKISGVICGRNDNYGGHLKESATYSINTLLDELDEVIYVDWNGFDEPLTDAIPLKNRHKLKVIVITPEKCKELMGEERYNNAQKVCEVLARNIGIRRATGDIIISTNPDIICPKRYLIDHMVSELKSNEMYTLARHDVEISELDKLFQGDLNNELVPIIFGLNSIYNRLMCPHTEVDKHVLDKYPENQHLSISSIICNCGDFQVAHRDTWYTIKGFEENKPKRMFEDSQVQYKVIMGGGSVKASNFPPLYHIEHERDPSHPINNPELIKHTTNLETWGFSDVEL